MGKHISIDDIVKDGLSDGKEQLNLGAWANMERLLDGKDPYKIIAPLPSDTSGSKMRKIGLSILGLLVLIGGLLGGIHLFKNKKHTDNHLAINNTTQTVTHTEPTAATQTTEAIQIETSTNVDNKNIASATNTLPILENLTTNTTQNNYTNNSNSNENTLTRKARRHAKKQANAQSNEVNNNNSYTNETVSTVDASALANNQKVSEAASNSIANTTSTNTNSEPSKPNKVTKPESEIVKNRTKKIENNTNTKTTINVDNIVLQPKKRSTRNSINLYDTIASTKTVIEKETAAKADIAKVTPVNPRLLLVNAEDELKANAKGSEIKKTIIEKPEVQITSLLKTETKAKKQVQKEGLMNRTANKLKDFSYNMKHFQNPFYFGISTGVNGDLFSKDHNFGGFHAGVTALLPINNSLSFLGELKYSIRNNSGYTLKDNSITPKSNIAPDYNSIPDSVVYNASFDNVDALYNFKSFSSIELPLILQYHYKSFDIYGGVNATLGLRINTSPTLNRTIVNQIDVLSINGGLPIYPTTKSFVYTDADFKPRVGIGYNFGFAYNFSKNIYVDMRLSQTITDNAKTITSKQISSTFFNVPYLQLSVGYKFGKGYRPNK
jgi:hypothetical protein